MKVKFENRKIVQIERLSKTLSRVKRKINKNKKYSSQAITSGFCTDPGPMQW
jgi:hypothetical protein